MPALNKANHLTRSVGCALRGFIITLGPAEVRYSVQLAAEERIPAALYCAAAANTTFSFSTAIIRCCEDHFSLGAPKFWGYSLSSLYSLRSSVAFITELCSRCSSVPLCRRSVPVTYTPAGAVTVPPPVLKHSSIADCIAAVLLVTPSPFAPKSVIRVFIFSTLPFHKKYISPRLHGGSHCLLLFPRP